MPEDKWERSKEYDLSREALYEFFESQGWGLDCEASIQDKNGDLWDSFSVMSGFYIRLRDGKVSYKDPEDNPPPVNN